MKTLEIPLHELAVIAATRAAAGAGIGLLIADKLNKDQRDTAGWLLLGLGILTTLPLAISVFRRLR